MNTDRKVAIVVGALFIVATVAGILSVGLLGSILNDGNQIESFSKYENRMIFGALLDLIGAGAFVGLAVVIFPILRRYSERLALSYVDARCFEAVPFFYILYKSKLHPRWLTIWGLIGVPFYLASKKENKMRFDNVCRCDRYLVGTLKKGAIVGATAGGRTQRVKWELDSNEL